MLTEKRGHDTCLSLAPVPVSVVTLGVGTPQRGSVQLHAVPCGVLCRPLPPAGPAGDHPGEGKQEARHCPVGDVASVPTEGTGLWEGKDDTPEPCSLCERGQSPWDSGHGGAGMGSRGSVLGRAQGTAPAFLLAWPRGAGAL